MIFRLTYNVEGVEQLALTQAVWILVGSGAMFLLVLFFRNYHRLFDYKYLLAIFAVLLIASTFTPLGYTVNGARLWVDLGPVGFQPSEFARIALVVFFAGYLAEKRDVMAATSRSFLGVELPAIKYFGPVALVWAASLGLLVFEKDLGSSLLFFAVPLLMLYVATGRIAYILLGGVLFFFGSFVTFLLFDHVQVRVQSWLDPWRDPDGTGFQILQSIFNIADGGLLGTGLGAGFAQTIPEVETDFVFSAIASELGLLGRDGRAARLPRLHLQGDQDSAPRRGRRLQAPRLRADGHVRPADAHHRRGGHQGDTPDRDHAPLRLLRRLFGGRQLRPDGPPVARLREGGP